MGIFSRIKDILVSFFRSIFQKKKDPAKEIDDYIVTLTEDLAKIKSEAASALAQEKRIKLQLDQAEEEAAKYALYARKAVLASNDGDARIFLRQKKEAEAKAERIRPMYETIRESSESVQKMYNKVLEDVRTLRARKDSIHAKMTMAETQEHLNALYSGIGKTASGMSAFDQMEEEAQTRLDKAQAVSELNRSETDPLKDLEAKYSGTSYRSEEDVEAELRELESQVSGMRG